MSAESERDILIAGERSQETLAALMKRRPLPSLRQFLADNGDGTYGDGFQAFYDLAVKTHDSDPLGLDKDSAAFLRMWLGMQIAVIELCNIESRRGRKPEEIVTTLPRVLAAAGMYATASVAKDDASMRQIATILIEEFRFAAKEAADQLEQTRDEAPRT